MDVLTSKWVKTRKSHLCQGCANMYEAGTKMLYTTSVDSGEFSTAYWCATCDCIIDKHYDYFDLQDGISFGEIRENDIGFWESTKIWRDRDKVLETAT